MKNLWLKRATSAWMKDKVIRLAPKVAGSSDLKNMRPICPYEVVRKIWTTIITKHIHLVWHHNEVLHPTQYGYLLDNGTEMPLINIINKVEKALHLIITTLVNFWDVRRAFDSIPRKLQRIAWVRLGVPPDIAEWFVQLDDGGLSYIATPHFFQKRKLRTSGQMSEHAEHFSVSDPRTIVFTAARGVGQGGESERCPRGLDHITMHDHE
jgi:hypothetical protein